MLTTKPCASVSFASLEYTYFVLKEKYDADEISFFAIVYHFAEDDDLDEEKKKRDHLHIFVIPNKRLNTDTLRGDLMELKDGEKPIRCMPFRSSKFDDWYLYSSHNERYLNSKGEFKKYHYNDDDFLCSDYFMFGELQRQINWQKLNGMERFINMIDSGMSFTQILQTGLVPIQLIAQYERFYEKYAFAHRGLTKGEFNSPSTPEQS